MSIKVPVLSVYDEAGNKIPIPAIQGKTAYAYAKDGGYTGTEKDFAAKMAEEHPTKEEVDALAGEVADKANKGISYFSLPEKVSVKVGSEFKVYFRNVISLGTALLWVGSNSNLETRYYEEYLSITPAAAGSHVLNWKLYDEASNLIESGSLIVAASEKAAHDTTKVLVIGDSTVNAGTMTEYARTLYANDGAKLSLLGTMGTAPNLHEGRGGWTAADYCTKASDASYTNPFYNNGFDFGYYMANQKYTGLQVVVIQLGINDVFIMKDTSYTGNAVLNYIDQMVSSILTYDSSIKVVINLPITPNSNGTSFTEAYGTTQLYWLYNRNSIRFSEELIEHFGGSANVTVSASNCILDTKTQINDGVHPTPEGYNDLGKRMYEVLISIVDGVAMAILDISERTYVVNTGTTITASGTRDLDTSKCFATQTNGTRSSALQNGIVYNALSSNSLSIIDNGDGTGGRGVEYPMDLEVGKTYTLKYTADKTNARVYLMKYNTDTTFNSAEMLSSAGGAFSKKITPESNLLYSVMFTPLGSSVAKTECIWTDISITEG